MLFQIFLYLKRGHAARPRSGNRLPIPPILHISAGKHAGNAGKDEVGRLHVAIIIKIDLTGKHLCVRHVPNAQKQPLMFRISSCW